ncbi:MAG: FtsW/RodA/SpoVE family cell cycle protein [Faecalimonas sp.]|nr:FtsW/RodA/SpoVE family cell cycle protein [Faecalimonas sp.]
MANIITECVKYLMILLITIYAYQCFTVFGYEEERTKQRVFRQQSRLIFMMHFFAYAGMYFQTGEIKLLLFYGVQALLLFGTIWAYMRLYPKVSRLIVNNMCLLLAIGFVMLTRLNYTKAIKQCIIAAGSVALSLLVPMLIRKARRLSELRLLYGAIGLVSLGVVVIAGQVSHGAKLGFEIAGIGIQPSEFVKIVFVFFVAASLYRAPSFRNVVITTVVAAFHVLILVISKDLGAALIIFMVYLVMLYVATRQPLYIAAGLGAGSVAAVGAYYLFNHVRVRVIVWQDPFAAYDKGGYQVAQALFAIGTGSWFGTGLFKGKADSIPVAEEDFIFAAIAEEMGLIFALGLVLVCLSCYIMFLNIAMRLKNQFYKLVALGLGTCYIFQTFINIGGVTKFVPSTGVTLPLVSYGGSSVLSTLVMFGIIQGLYILREDEEALERRKEEHKKVNKAKAPAKQRVR